MKKRIRTMVIAFLTAAISCITVFAATGYQSAQIYYKNIKIIIDGEQITPKDVLGNIVDPFIMDGTTYLPVRAVSEALGMDVVWDGKTYTVYLNTPAVPPPPKPKVTYMFDVLQAYEKQGSYTKDYKENVSFKMLGDEYTNGCMMENVYMDNDIRALYNLRGQYKTIKGMLGHIDGTSDAEGTFYIYLDDTLYKEYPLTGNMLYSKAKRFARNRNQGETPPPLRRFPSPVRGGLGANFLASPGRGGGPSADGGGVWTLMLHIFF